MHLAPGRQVDLPHGSLLVTFDRAPGGKAWDSPEGRLLVDSRVRVAAFVVDDSREDRLSEVWCRTSGESWAFDAAAKAALAGLCERFNRCRWCGDAITGPRTLVAVRRRLVAEHDVHCPWRQAAPGEPCARCGRQITEYHVQSLHGLGGARREFARGKASGWVNRHVQDCLTQPIPDSDEEDAELRRRLFRERRAKARDEAARGEAAHRRRKTAEARASTS